MKGREQQPALDDPRVVEALEEYLALAEEGQPPNRQAFLARHAEIAEALAECLDGLQALQVASSSSQQPSSAAEMASPLAEGPPVTPLGDFRIIREIGRGGMGVVYEAEQMSLGRRVALKVLPFAAALDARQLQRFKNEAQAAAQLHHQHIVPVYGVGCERGVHYYAMQLIEGQNLAAVVAELRRGAAPDGPSGTRPKVHDVSTGPYPTQPQPASNPGSDTLPNLGAQLSTQRSNRAADFFRTVARLVAQAAEGLDHAHSVGVVHRDVKPANLLVDYRGNVWITDFGLAQFHADVGLTQTGDLLGTLRYMSPEQAGGQRVVIDHRTDVYSLGATLYELLTLRPIFDGADRQTLLQQILHEEPRPLRALDRSIPPELETIALKAVAKVPAERYATARDFADDLHRFLRHEPIRARRATLVQRARKWLRRHPSVPVAAAVLLVLVSAGSLASAWVIRGEQEKTRLAYERERQLARQAVDEMIRVSQEELADRPGTEGLRKRLLESALDYYQQFIAQRQDDPGARADLAATQERVKKILDDLAVLQGAGRMFLLGDRAVQEELGVTGGQKERFGDLGRRAGEQMLASFRDFQQLGPDERRQRFLDLVRANDAEINAILTAPQRQRLGQIVLQARGTAAFQDPDVVTALKLTAGQKERIRVIEADTFFGRPEGFRPGPPPGGPPGGPPGKPPWQWREQAMERIQALLTEEQAARWKDMTGEPFKLAFPAPGPPPPGPFRQP